MRRLVLVRHGESRWNAEARIQGQECEGLSDLGHEQAAATAAALIATYPDVRLVASDLQRCVETAQPFEQLVEAVAERDARLRERSFGAWEGLRRDDVIVEDPDRWERWLAGEDVIAEIGGESAVQLADRTVPVWQELLDATPDGGVTIAVTHGGPVWHGIHRILGLPARTLGGVDNASVTELVAWEGGHGAWEAGIALDRWNEVAHLPPAMRSGWRPRTRSDASAAGR